MKSKKATRTIGAMLMAGALIMSTMVKGTDINALTSDHGVEELDYPTYRTFRGVGWSDTKVYHRTTVRLYKVSNNEFVVGADKTGRGTVIAETKWHKVNNTTTTASYFYTMLDVTYPSTK